MLTPSRTPSLLATPTPPLSPRQGSCWEKLQASALCGPRLALGSSFSVFTPYTSLCLAGAVCFCVPLSPRVSLVPCVCPRMSLAQPAVSSPVHLALWACVSLSSLLKSHDCSQVLAAGEKEPGFFWNFPEKRWWGEEFPGHPRFQKVLELFPSLSTKSAEGLTSTEKIFLRRPGAPGSSSPSAVGGRTRPG